MDDVALRNPDRRALRGARSPVRCFRHGISFFDIDFQELSFFDARKQSPYCRYRRKDKDFIERCRVCDKKYFDLARQTSRIQIYRCHTKLLDGIVPLYDDHKKFLGGIIFGQTRPAGQKNPHPPGTMAWKYYDQVPVCSMKKMEQIGRLLQWITEGIIRRRMVAYRSLVWTEILERYIESHIDKRITIRHLAQLVHRSPSFISHYFKRELGKSPATYIQDKRMEIARQMLQGGDQVKQVADHLGFYDAFHFSKLFKKHFGKPPMAFRSPAQSNDPARTGK